MHPLRLEAVRKLGWISVLGGLGWAAASTGRADLQIPVAPPASLPAAPPVAQPVDPVSLPPIAPPASVPSASPVAMPVVAPPPSADETTNSAAVPPTGGLVIVASPVAERFDTAMASFNAGKFAEAIPEFSDFVHSFPQDRRCEEALYRLAESYRNLGRADDALAAYTYQVQTYPEGPLRISGELRRGALLSGAGKFTDAMVPLQYVSEKGDGELQQAATYLLGRAYLLTQKEPEGRAALQTLVDAQPPGKFAGSAAQALAELDDSQNQHPAALALWQKALAFSTDPAIQATAAARGGWSALSAKQPRDAEKLFQLTRVLQVDGEARKVATTGLLRLLFQEKRYADWLFAYLPDQGKLLDSAQEEISYDLGHVQFSLKHWPEAVAAFDRYLRDFGSRDSAVTAAYERYLAATQVDRTQIVSETEAYLKAWPQSPYRTRVQLLEAQELSREKKFADALPLWENLAALPQGDSLPHQEILLDLARTYDELENFPKAAPAYQAYLDDLTSHPLEDKKTQATQVLSTQARLAVCLQKAGQLTAATEAWKAVQSLAPEGSSTQQAALESLGLIYARGGPAQESAEVVVFRQLLDKFPKTSLAGMAAFSVGDSSFRNRDYAGAEPFLLRARDADKTTWLQPATQRLVLGAYGQKNEAQTLSYLQQYEATSPPADPDAQKVTRLPAALFYWLAETARKAGKWEEAEAFYTRVTQHADPADLLAGAWWQLGSVQAERKEWPAAVASDEKYRELKPESKDATVVLLALGRAQLGAGHFDEARQLGEQALLQEPEGTNSAEARMLLGEAAFAIQDFSGAAKMFVPLAVLFDDPKITPQAMARAAESLEKSGDTKGADDWRQKLKEKYPDFVPTAYL